MRKVPSASMYPWGKLVRLIFLSSFSLTIAIVCGCSTYDCKSKDQFGRKKKNDPEENPACQENDAAATEDNREETILPESSSSGASSPETAQESETSSGMLDFGCGVSCNSDCKMYLMGGEAASGQQNSIYTSSNGSTWTLSSSFSGARAYGGSVVFEGKLWFLGGNDGTGDQTNVWTTSDGQSWITAGTLPIGIAPFQSVAAFPAVKLIYVLGGGVTHATTHILSSPNGNNWSLGGLASATSRNAVAQLGSQMFTWGGFDNGVLSSVRFGIFPSGASWKSRASGLPSPLADMSVARFNGKIWMAGGYDGSAIKTTVMNTSDGLTWVIVGNLPDSRRLGSMVSYKGKLWFMGGIDSNSMRVDTIWSSSDGVSWLSSGTLPTPMTGASLSVFSTSCGTGSI